VIFAALNANYHELRLILQFELPQLRKYMNAVYSAIRPEIQKHYFPTEIGKRKPPATGMNPVEIVRKVGRSY
jgi:hypothetical protein